MNKNSISFYPISTSGKHSSNIVFIVLKPDTPFTVSSYGSLVTVFVRYGPFVLASKDKSPIWKELGIEVINDDKICVVVPSIKVEEPSEVHVSVGAQGSNPPGKGGLAETRRSCEDEGSYPILSDYVKWTRR